MYAALPMTPLSMSVLPISVLFMPALSLLVYVCPAYICPVYACLTYACPVYPPDLPMPAHTYIHTYMHIYGKAIPCLIIMIKIDLFAVISFVQMTQNNAYFAYIYPAHNRGCATECSSNVLHIRNAKYFCFRARLPFLVRCRVIRH